MAIDLEKWANEKAIPETGGGPSTEYRRCLREFFPLIEWAGKMACDEEHYPDCPGCKGRRILRDLGIEPPSRREGE